MFTIHAVYLGWNLYFVCDPILQTRKVRLFTNYPSAALTADTQSTTNPSRFSELKWKTDKASYLVGGYSRVSDSIVLNVPGAYKFYYTCDGR